MALTVGGENNACHEVHNAAALIGGCVLKVDKNGSAGSQGSGDLFDLFKCSGNKWIDFNLLPVYGACGLGIALTSAAA